MGGAGGRGQVRFALVLASSFLPWVSLGSGINCLFVLLNYKFGGVGIDYSFTATLRVNSLPGKALRYSLSCS